MTLHLLASLSSPSNPPRPNEDAFCATARLAAVFDGATPLNPPLLPGGSDAAWIAALGAARLAARAGEARGGDLLRRVLGDVEAAYARERSRPPEHPYERPLASLMMVEAGDGRLEALWLGDCSALVRRPGGRVEVVGEAFDKRAAEAARAAEVAARTGLPVAGDTNRPEVLAGLRASRDRCNTPTGAWVFAPDAGVADHAQTLTLQAPAGTVALLVSDGFLALACDYGRYDPDAFVAAAESRGLPALLDELRAVEAADPEGRLYPRFKTRDDATALLLQVS